jgi:enoyl-CoA hydratase/carnithine racemase
VPLTGKDIVLYEKQGKIVTITLNRPERLNSLTPESFDRLEECWAKFRDDDDLVVAILTGSGDKAFCAGVDLKHMAEMTERGQLITDVLREDSGNPLAAGLYKPIIAAINGYATAGGAYLLMYCDLRVAADSARVGITEAKVGRGTAWVAPLAWQLPQAIALEMLLTGEFMSAERLLKAGWINEMVPAENLMPTAMRLAEKISENAPLSVRAAKENWYKSIEPFCQAGLKISREIFAPLYASEDAKEGPRAFAEKRKPVWKGR